MGGLRGEAAPTLAPRYSRFGTYLVNLRLLNPTRRARSKTTGQIQNLEDFFEAGIAGVPTEWRSNSGLEFGARVRGGFSRQRTAGRIASTPSRKCPSPAAGISGA